jgi:predicted kinase
MLCAKGSRVTMLVLINGAPGSGKSTLAQLLAQDEPLSLALDVDVIKHSLGQWETAMPESGLTARRLAMMMIADQLSRGRHVIVGQFLARTEFIEQLAALATEHRAGFAELILSADPDTLTSRLHNRAVHPERADHVINATQVTLDDVPGFIEAIEQLIKRRPAARLIDANGSVTETLDLIRSVLSRNC